MKTLALGCVVLALLVPAAAFSRGGGGGGMGSHHSGGSVTGGAFGTNPAAPGTNSAGTALSTSGTAGGSALKGPALGTGDPTVDPAGFRLTVPVCQRAERQNDPLAKTPECVQLLQAARDQAEACRQAFENGDDKVALSPACRQAASFR